MPNKIIKNYSDLGSVNRYDVISNAITFIKGKNVSGFYNKRDLTYLIKVLLENGTVRLSEEAHKNCDKLWKTKNILSWQDTALNNMVKHLPQQNKYLQNAICRSIFTWEHVVPTSILVEKLLEEWNLKTLTSNFVNNMIDKYGFVCIITKNEDKILNTEYRDTMPNGWIYGKDDAFARYNAVGIKLV